MDALRYIQKITSDSLTLKHLGKYLGKNVEIIILPLDTEADNQGKKKYKSVKGILHEYADPSLIEKEKKAFQDAIKEKHAIR